MTWLTPQRTIAAGRGRWIGRSSSVTAPGDRAVVHVEQGPQQGGLARAVRTEQRDDPTGGTARLTQHHVVVDDLKVLNL
ncbi:hypothetical protein [Dactylosporangium fulvum]|uniref:Uncharacterized protein n=1 Tax=Dactylosporangium fulvum TaxID=53359 RepID=A0ABY5W375_9ACTN|nr:hypothetical protein [Dactylosporangium fulvum]UWP83835.1 hypothetical protein Dfulv_06130 [Dactylosporangium fulvum]